MDPNSRIRLTLDFHLNLDQAFPSNLESVSVAGSFHLTNQQLDLIPIHWLIFGFNQISGAALACIQSSCADKINEADLDQLPHWPWDITWVELELIKHGIVMMMMMMSPG